MMLEATISIFAVVVVVVVAVMSVITVLIMMSLSNDHFCVKILSGR